MKIHLFIYILFSSLLSFSQVLDTLQWRESYRLTWDDFKGVPQPGRPEGALTGVEFIYGVMGQGEEIQCIVMVYFNRQASWGLDKYKNSYVLSHEQGHFDLYEIKARKLREILSKKTFHLKTLQEDIQKIAEKILEEAEREQKIYDRETGFGVSEDNQQKWSKKISGDLKSSIQYKNCTLTLSLK